MDYIYDLIARGGPEPQEYEKLTAWICDLGDKVRAGDLVRGAVTSAWRDLNRAHFRGTMQALVVETPHGYHGDFEFIDGVYCRRHSSDPRLVRWDGYLQAQAAPRAVRNRKTYFHSVLQQCCRRSTGTVSVLNIASGPGRDVVEWLEAYGGSAVHFD